MKMSSTEQATPTAAMATGSARVAIRQDFRCSSAAQRIALVAVVFWLAYEWGAGNEALTPWLIARTIASTSGLKSILVTALVGFTFTLVQQLVSGSTALVGFSMFENTTAVAWNRLQRRLGDSAKGWSGLGILSRTVLVFGLGTTAVVLVETVTSGHVDRRRHRPVVLQSAVLCASAVGAIAAIAATLAIVGRRVDALRGSTELILRVLGNPLLWIGLVVIVIAVQAARTPTRAD